MTPYVGAYHDEFAWHLVKYLREDAVLRSEAEAERPGALFTMDFVVEVPREDGTLRRVAFEIGGGRTLRDHERYLRRDAAVLASGAVDALYRLQGPDLIQRTADALYLASRWDADLFSGRGCYNLGALASPEARRVEVRPERVSALVLYALDAAQEAEAPERKLWHVVNGRGAHVLVRRLSAGHPEAWQPYVPTAH